MQFINFFCFGLNATVNKLGVFLLEIDEKLVGMQKKLMWKQNITKNIN